MNGAEGDEMAGNPQTLIENHCAALLKLYPHDGKLYSVVAFAHHRLVTERMLRVLCIAYHHHEGPARAHVAGLHALLDHEDANLPVTVTEIRDEDNRPIYRVTNMAGTQLYAWLERGGWESTGWTLASDFDNVGPVPGREDMERGAWPVGLASLISEALADLDTSEPWSAP